MPDKILATNTSALSTKYGARGRQAVLEAVKALIASDKRRGLTTQLVDLSNAAAMKKFKGKPVTSPKNERQNKDAVDAICAKAKPDYLALIDAPDVVPHLLLDNPAAGDGDQRVPSDLPYASEAPFRTRDPAAFASVTRVVGRIPGVTGAKDPAFLVKQLKLAADFKRLDRSDYLPHFSISAAVWEKSTEESVGNIFGSSTIKLCPPTVSPGVEASLAPLTHFINCHGAEVDPTFYGQSGTQYPKAMTSDDVAKGAKPNAVIAAECCYGAQLYDPDLADGKWPISNAYLNAGAAGFFGSTTIAYGPAEGNGAADLLAQYFLISALAGASLGRACLQARQKFVLGEKMEDPVNLKTLAQFILLADPSLQLCPAEQKGAVADAPLVDGGAARAVRRIALAAAGKAASDSSGYPGKRLASPPSRLRASVLRIAKERGFRASAKNLAAFQVVGKGNYGAAMKERRATQKVLMLMEHDQATTHMPKGLRRTRVFVAHAQDDRLVGVAEYVRR